MNRIVLIVALALIAACSPPAEKAKGQGAAPAQGAPAGSSVARAGVASNDLMLTKAPIAGARVASPLSVEGSAPNDWFSAGEFVAQLVNANGVVIAQAPALPQSDWQQPGPVPFIADLVFDVAADTPATLLLQEPDGEAPREKRVAVVLAGR